MGSEPAAFPGSFQTAELPSDLSDITSSSQPDEDIPALVANGESVEESELDENEESGVVVDVGDDEQMSTREEEHLPVIQTYREGSFLNKYQPIPHW